MANGYPITDPSSAFAPDVQSRKSKTGPVTDAIRAMRNEGPQRRNLLKAAGAVLVGTVLGAAPYKTGRDLTAVAEGWLIDAYELGMVLIVQPDGHIWRSVPVRDGAERAAARNAHWDKLENRPPLMRAVRRAVRNGFAPWA